MRWLPHRRQILEFSRRLGKLSGVRSIFLYGSMARGDYNTGSDVDILVISDSLPERFLDRTELLQRLTPADLPLEIVGYTSSEFEKMLVERHPTALSALEEGKILHDDGFHREAMKVYRLVKKRTGLRRIENGWVAEKLVPSMMVRRRTKDSSML